jgi:circadian clock protein KaiC
MPSRPTGVPHLDRVLGGGVPAGDTLLVLGPTGSGKTTLALQMAFHAAAEGGVVCFVSTSSESPQRLLEHARTYDFYAESHIGSRIFLLNAFPLLKSGLGPVKEALEREVREHGATLVVIDGLATFYASHRDAGALRAFLAEVSTTLSALGCTLLVTSGRIAVDRVDEAPELTMADGLLILSQTLRGSRSERHLQVVKLRGHSPLLGLHTARVDHRGVAVFPRFESLEPAGDFEVSGERLLTGFPELDRMLSGGVRVGSFTALAGSVGTGKSLLSLHFLLEGARSGQRGLLFSLRETRAEIIDRAGSFGLDLAAALRDGTIVFARHSPVDLSADIFVQELDETIRGGDFQRLVLDGIVELTDAVPEENRRATLVRLLSHLLRARGITAVVPVPVSQLVGPELELERTPLAALAQNLILLRNVEYDGELYRILSILKARDTAFDPTIRRYTITSAGLRLLAPTDTADGLLSGIARLASEARVKRATPPDDA